MLVMNFLVFITGSQLTKIIIIKKRMSSVKSVKAEILSIFLKTENE